MDTLTTGCPTAADITVTDTHCLAPVWAQIVEATTDGQGGVLCAAVAEYHGHQISAPWNEDAGDFARPVIYTYGLITRDLTEAKRIADELADTVATLDTAVFAAYRPRPIIWE